MRENIRPIRSLLLAVAGLAFLPAAVRGDAIIQVNADTSQLPSSGTYALDFQFALGGTTPNSATIENLVLGTGTTLGSTGPYPPIGTVIGNLPGPTTLVATDASSFVDYNLFFTPGGTLSFEVDLTNQPQTGNNADTFTFNILALDPMSGNFYNITTANPSGNNSFLEIDSNGGTIPVVIASPSTDPNYPLLTPQANVVPEPTSVVLFLTNGALAVLGYRRGWFCRKPDRNAAAPVLV